MSVFNSIVHNTSADFRWRKLFSSLHWSLNILAMLLWSAGLGIVSLYYARPGYGRELFFSYLQTPLILALNLIPIALFVFLIFFLTNRVWISVFVSGALIVVISLINYFKLLFRGDPLLATDIAYLNEAARTGGDYNIFLDWTILATFAAVILLTVFSFFFLRARFEKPLPRVGGFLLVVIAGVLLYTNVYKSWDVYTDTKNLDVFMSNGKVMSQWSATDQYVCRGFIYPLIYSSKSLNNDKPEDYNKKEAEELLDSYQYDDIPDDKKVSVIAVMYEAYNDFSTFGLEFENDPYAFFHELQEESVSGQLVTNIFAGDTINTERTFITGSLTKYEYRKQADSYARYFNEQGYFTEFCHPGYGWFYNRQNVYGYLGFSSDWFFETRYTMPDGWGIMHDGGFLPDLTVLFEDALAAGTPYFNFSVTYQNHGPYDEGARTSDTVYYQSPDLSLSGSNIFNNYLAGIAETDAAMGDFIGYFKAREEPVVVVFFGDHNPWLGDAAWVYEELGINLDLATEDGFYNYYTTPYIIWANDAAKTALGNDFTGDGGSFSPCFLMAKLFDLCAWEGNELMKINRSLRDHTDIVHVTGAVRENGILSERPSEDTTAAIDAYTNLMYYLLRDRY